MGLTNVRFYSQGKYTRLFHSLKPPDMAQWQDAPHRIRRQKNHCCCRTKNLPRNFHHTGLDRTGRYYIQKKVDDNFTQSNSFKKKKKKRSSNDRVLLLGWVQGVTYQCQATRVEKLTGRSKCLIKPTWFDREEQSQSWIDSCRLMLKSVLWLWLPLAVLPLLTMSTYSIWLPFRLQLFKSSILPMLFS